MTVSPSNHLFEGFGVELEYMIVDADSLSVSPIADRLLESVAGEITSEVEQGQISWSNELALHVIELKTTKPAASLDPVAFLFQEQVIQINLLLEKWGARLMPTAMHPWMNPDREMRLWPHDNSTIYETFNRIFDCRGHGWSNLQSVHLNLPFANDQQFARLHAAVRLVLPLLPAIAASSPAMDGKLTGFSDSRLHVYRSNSCRIPSIAGRIIPEPVYSRAEYEREILQRMYDDIAPHDPEGVLRHEWLNARGAIARFDRNTIEIRVLDIQECPQADVAICMLIVDVLKSLVSEQWSSLAIQQAFPTVSLESLFLSTIREGHRAIIRDENYLQLFGPLPTKEYTAGELWRHLCGTPRSGLSITEPEIRNPLDIIVSRGTLSSRIADALGVNPSVEQLRSVYRRLCNCLATGQMLG
jgi:glutamate---cysteine ligase / carboxylate-amine ligase